jgi:hypothetical protein
MSSTERVDRRCADRNEVLVVGFVVLGQVDDVLELVEVYFSLGERRVGLVVVREVNEFDGDTLVSRCIHVGFPVRVARTNNADLDGFVLAARGVRGAGVSGAACQQRGDGQYCEGGERALQG